MRTPKKTWLIFCAVLSLSIAIAIGQWTTPYMAIASFAYFSLCIGVLFRSRKEFHIPLVVTAVAIDISLVLILEVQRSAIATAMGGKLNTLQLGHIAFSLAAVVLYIPTIVFGVRSLQSASKGKNRKIHTRLGKIAFICRTIGFILMFSLLDYLKT